MGVGMPVPLSCPDTIPLGIQAHPLSSLGRGPSSWAGMSLLIPGHSFPISATSIAASGRQTG